MRFFHAFVWENSDKSLFLVVGGQWSVVRSQIFALKTLELPAADLYTTERGDCKSLKRRVRNSTVNLQPFRFSFNIANTSRFVFMQGNWQNVKFFNVVIDSVTTDH